MAYNGGGNMAGKIERGFEPIDPVEPVEGLAADAEGVGADDVDETADAGVVLVSLETPGFSGDVLSLYELPSYMVLNVITAPALIQLRGLAQLFDLAAGRTGPDEGPGTDVLEGLSYLQMSEVLHAWVKASGRTPEAKATLGGPFFE